MHLVSSTKTLINKNSKMMDKMNYNHFVGAHNINISNMNAHYVRDELKIIINNMTLQLSIIIE